MTHVAIEIPTNAHVRDMEDCQNANTNNAPAAALAMLVTVSIEMVRIIFCLLISSELVIGLSGILPVHFQQV